MTAFFPNPAEVNQIYTSPSGITYEFTAKGVWRVISGPAGDSITFTANPNPPSTPNLGDQWFDTINRGLKSWATDGINYFWEIIGNQPFVGGNEPIDKIPGMLWYNVTTKEMFVWIVIDNVGGWKLIYSELMNSAELILSRAIPASLAYQDEGYSFEFFTANKMFNWRTIDPIAVLNATNGDDTITLVNTAGIVQGKIYTLEDGTGNLIKEVEVLSILSNSIIRVTQPLDVNLVAANNAKFATTTMEMQDGKALTSNGDVFYSKPLDVLRNWPDGKFFIRRTAQGQGIFTVSWRYVGDSVWNTVDLVKVSPVFEQTGQRDEEYHVDATGYVEMRIKYTANVGVTDTIFHFGLVTASQSLDNARVEKPSNVTPADGTVNLTATPTLTGSTYRSLYNIAQGGAEFQVAQDDQFTNIAYSTSSDFMASWLAIAGQTNEYRAAIFFNDLLNGVVIGDAATSQITTDGGLTFSNGGTITGSTGVNSIDWTNTGNLTVAAGKVGGLWYSANKTVTWTKATPPNSYAGEYKGIIVLASGGIVVAVGTAAQISRSTNGGVIWTTIAPAANFANDFNGLAVDITGNLIAVGANGEIQTSNNAGLNWLKRSQAGNYTGAFQAVCLNDEGDAIAVGANGQIQTSTDYGASWTTRPADNSYTGTFRAVAISGDYAVAVGDTGEIQTSYNRGVSWTHRTAGGAETRSLRTVAIAPAAQNYAMVAGQTGALQRTMKLAGATITVTVPSGPDLLITNQIYYWRVRYRDEVGFWSGWSDPTAFATKSNFNSVRQPANISPANNAVNISVTPTLQSSAFAYLGALDTHIKSQWQISTSGNFENPVYSSGDVNDLIAHTVPTVNQLVNNTQYFWRVRHKATNLNDYSPWSEPTSFTAMALPNKPTLTAPANGAVGQALRPTLTSSAFAIPAAGIAHLASQWQVSLNAGFTQIAHDSGQSTALTSYLLPAGILVAATPYYARVRHKGVGTEYGEWSNANVFTTSDVTVNTPTISAGAITTSTANLASSAFSITGAGASDSHMASDWEVRTAAGGGGSLVFSSTGNVNNKNSITASGLPTGTSLFARTRQRGTTYGYSNWSADVNFQTASPVGQQIFTGIGSFQFIVPAGVTSVCAVAIGGGGTGNTAGGGGGALAYYNNYPVTPGQPITVVVGGPGQTSSFGSVISAGGGTTGSVTTTTSQSTVGDNGAGGGTITRSTWNPGVGGNPLGGTGYSGGRGGGPTTGAFFGGGGGAGGYGGPGGNAGAGNQDAGGNGTGGAGGGGRSGGAAYGGGGGVAFNGIGADGAGDSTGNGGGGGSGGNKGDPKGFGGLYGGGGCRTNAGAQGAVRVIWGAGRAFPFNAA